MTKVLETALLVGAMGMMACVELALFFGISKAIADFVRKWLVLKPYMGDEALAEKVADAHMERVLRFLPMSEEQAMSLHQELVETINAYVDACRRPKGKAFSTCKGYLWAAQSSLIKRQAFVGGKP